MTFIHFLHTIVDPQFSHIHPFSLIYGVCEVQREMATEGAAGQVCDSGREVGHGS